jgi:hypothetical protein
LPRKKILFVWTKTKKKFFYFREQGCRDPDSFFGFVCSNNYSHRMSYCDIIFSL